MGCLNAKLMPDFEDGELPETVFAMAPRSKADKLKDDFDDLKSSLKEKEQAKQVEEAVKEEEKLPELQKPKFTLRIDPRVTAKYDVKALIGKGSFSRVLRVENKVTRNPYAIKIIDRSQGKDVFESELAVLRRVRHKYVIQLVEVFASSKDKVYMVMELATGGELFDRIIAKGHFTEQDASGVMKMVMEGLRYLHGLGITHRDLKPENLLYYHPGPDSKILITDFGLSATHLPGDDFMKTTCGTPEYIAPEMLAKQPYNCLVDEWAAGVICFIMLSGTMPFEDDVRSRLFKQILRVEYSYSAEPWSHISDRAKDFINKLLVKDANERMTAAQALRHSWLTCGSANSSNKNLHRTISNNLIHRQQSTKANSTRSNRSTRSTKSSRSNRSLRSEHRRVLPEEIERLHQDPDFRAELGSMSSRGKAKTKTSEHDTKGAEPTESTNADSSPTAGASLETSDEPQPDSLTLVVQSKEESTKAAESSEKCHSNEQCADKIDNQNTESIDELTASRPTTPVEQDCAS